MLKTELLLLEQLVNRDPKSVCVIDHYWFSDNRQVIVTIERPYLGCIVTTYTIVILGCIVTAYTIVILGCIVTTHDTIVID